ncbi:MAG TPA: carboxypeptidase regulatory-like domain-containing protein, partial [Archangium sp.]
YGDTVGSRSPLGMQAREVRRTGTSAGVAMNLHGLVEADGVDLEHLGELAVAWSSLDYGRPLVTWMEPAEDGQSVARGAKVKVRVLGFRVGSGSLDDGYVRLTFAGAPGCVSPVNGYVVEGRGEVELQLPGTCTGVGVQLNATLVDTAGVDLSPPVTSSRTLTIN